MSLFFVGSNYSEKDLQFMCIVLKILHWEFEMYDFFFRKKVTNMGKNTDFRSPGFQRQHFSLIVIFSYSESIYVSYFKISISPFLILILNQNLTSDITYCHPIIRLIHFIKCLTVEANFCKEGTCLKMSACYCFLSVIIKSL